MTKIFYLKIMNYVVVIKAELLICWLYLLIKEKKDMKI